MNKVKCFDEYNNRPEYAVDEIVNMLITGKYEITSDYVEARSIAICAGIILDELREGINL